MNELLLSNADTIRLAFFVGVFAVMAVWETLVPRRQRAFARLRRWPGNIGIVALNTLILKIALPVAAVEFAAVASERGWGLLANTGLPFWVEFLLAVMILDLVIYLQHVMFHAVPALWRR